MREKIETAIEMGQLGMFAFLAQIILLIFILNQRIAGSLTQSTLIWETTLFGDLQIITTIGAICFAINIVRSHSGI